MQLFTRVSPNPDSLSYPLSFFSFQPPCRALYCNTSRPWRAVPSPRTYEEGVEGGHMFVGLRGDAYGRSPIYALEVASLRILMLRPAPAYYLSVRELRSLEVWSSKRRLEATWSSTWTAMSFATLFAMLGCVARGTRCRRRRGHVFEKGSRLDGAALVVWISPKFRVQGRRWARPRTISCVLSSA